MRAFYDTCICLLAQNPADRDHASCALLVDSREITWSVGFSEVSRGEATIGEYLDWFIRTCALQGIECREIKMPAIKAEQRGRLALRRQLRSLGVQGNDSNQVFAALGLKSELLASRDRDFCDPAQKRRRGKAVSRGPVERFLASEAIELLFPKAAVGRLRSAA